MKDLIRKVLKEEQTNMFNSKSEEVKYNRKKELRDLIAVILMDLSITDDVMEGMSDEIADDVEHFIEKYYIPKQ